ncbi:DUF1507 family protein [Enterococcus hirae]|jgi:uncharacterized protein YlaN (UPF0358 family)|nr:YlaN family protein [Enterococcaceae bacterium]MCI1919913.1 YlaN family protein [Enterococcaceae bacterium]MDM8213279.1 DUF1507 family protein [Enterococcus hirae]
MDTQDQKRAVLLLEKEAERIKQLIQNQNNSLCIAQCKAFEEVVDTQMYGFSRQISYAIQLGVVESSAGHQILADLERELNTLYSKIYQGQRDQKEV